MDRVFSVDDISDQFWSQPPPPAVHLSSQSNNREEQNKSSSLMNRSSSEWAFQRFLQEASASDPNPPPASKNDVVVEVKDHDPPPPPPQSSGPPNVPIDSEEYQAFLKSRLNLACAAVALTRASCVKPSDTATLPDNGSEASNASQLGSQVPPKGSSGFDPSKGQSDKDGSAAPLGIPSLPSLQKKSPVQVKSTTSGSSRDQSDDDELDLDTETTQNMDPADVKRVRRRQSLMIMRTRQSNINKASPS